MTLWRDVRYAVRLLAKAPAFTVAVIATLALGIAANTTIFTLINALLLRPLPYADPDRLVLVTSLDRAQEGRVGCLTQARFTQIAGETGVFASLAAYAGDTTTIKTTGNAEQVQAGRVSWNFFDVLAVTPALGRRFVAEDERGSANVIISDSLWRRAFGASPDVVGRSLSVDERPATIVGVLPATFTFGLLDSHVEVWLPHVDELSLATPEQLRGGTCYLNAVGRLPERGGLAQARARMDVLNRRYAQAFAKMPDADQARRVPVEPLRDVLVAGTGPMLTMLVGAVALVLLVACANVTGLLLTRSIGRRRELAMRVALGATRWTLVRQLLIESVVLAGAGGVAGGLLAVWATRALGATLAAVLSRGEPVGGMDLRVLGFTAGLSLLTGLASGLVPALQFSRPDLVALSRGDEAPARGRLRAVIVRRLIVITQVALTVVLLVSAGLLVRTFRQLSALDAGFDPRGMLTLRLSLPHARYATSPAMAAFYTVLVERMRRLPGVESTAVASALPVNPTRASPVLIEGQPAVPLSERPVITLQMVLGPYFRVMKIPLVRGRVFDERDVASSPPVVIVRYLQGQDPVGKHITLGRRPAPAEIVGVVGDVKNEALASETTPEIAVPFPQLAWASMNVLVRTHGNPMAAAGTVRVAIASVDEDLPATGVRTMEDVLSEARSRPKVLMTLLSLFAASGVLLATIGLYGLVAHSVSQRRQEMGVRLALGARPHTLVWSVVRQALALAAVGVGIGLVASLAATRLLASLMFQVTTTDAMAFSLGPAALLVAGAFAAWVPARRIAEVNPSDALRAQ